jgi:hypothetical protein
VDEHAELDIGNVDFLEHRSGAPACHAVPPAGSCRSNS